MNAEDTFALIIFDHDDDAVYFKHVWVFPISRKEEISINGAIMQKECDKIHFDGMDEIRELRISWAALSKEEYMRKDQNFWNHITYKKDQVKKEFIGKYCYNPIELSNIQKYSSDILPSDDTYVR